MLRYKGFQKENKWRIGGCFEVFGKDFWWDVDGLYTPRELSNKEEQRWVDQVSDFPSKAW